MSSAPLAMKVIPSKSTLTFLSFKNVYYISSHIENKIKIILCSALIQIPSYSHNSVHHCSQHYVNNNNCFSLLLLCLKSLHEQ